MRLARRRRSSRAAAAFGRLGQILLLSATAAAAVVGPIAARVDRVPPLVPGAAFVDSLMSTTDYPTLLQVLPPLIDGATARHDSTLLGRLLLARGRAEFGAADPRRAEATLTVAIDIARAVRDTTLWMTSLGFKGMALGVQERYVDVLNTQRQRLALARRVGDRTSEAWAQTSIGYSLLSTGDLSGARNAYAAGVSLFDATGDLHNKLNPLVGLGRVLDTMGEIDAAADCYRNALATAREIGDRGQEGHALNNLGVIEFDNGDVSVAAQYFEKAWEAQRSAGDFWSAIPPATNVALCRTYLGQYTDALAILKEALTTCERRGMNDMTAEVLTELGNTCLQQNRPHAAVDYFRRSLQASPGQAVTNRLETIYGLGEALFACDSVGSATSILTKHLDTAANVGGLWYARFEILLSRCLRGLGRSEEALQRSLRAQAAMRGERDPRRRADALLELTACYRETRDLAAAREMFERCLDEFAAARRSTGTYDWRENYAQQTAAGVFDQCGVLLAWPRDRPHDARVRDLFNAVQRVKAHTLLERITGPPRRQGVPADEPVLEAVPIDSLQTTVLKPGEVLLDFATGRKETWLFAVTRDSCRVVTLPGFGSALNNNVTLLSKMIAAVGHRVIAQNDVADIAKIQAAVGSAILGQVADVLRGANRILVAPDAFYWNVPFAALIIPLPGRDANTPLVDAFEIVHVPSASVLALLRGRRARMEVPNERIFALQGDPAGTLPGARREIAQLHRRYTRVEILSGSTGRAAFETAASKAAVLHIAAHAESNEEKPWHSGILLGAGPDTASAGERGATPEEVHADPYLRAGEIARMRVGARLTVLSGCETAGGRASGGEGLLGLGSAFLTAGSPTVVATLWPVSDRVTADFVEIFYRELAGGATAAAALRRAQETIRRGHRTAHPFYWAGVVVLGDGDTSVALSPRGTLRRTMLFIILVGTLGMALAGLFFRRRMNVGRNHL